MATSQHPFGPKLDELPQAQDLYFTEGGERGGLRTCSCDNDGAPARGRPPRPGRRVDTIREVLGWEPERPALDDIIAGVWPWLQEHPSEYAP